ncbi:MAG: metal-dependent transcriptional regulator, partial [Aggregatilineales bacterium]
YLTALGERIALKIIRRHRLIELYLVRELGYALHEVHDEAEALEHTVSERFIQAISDKMDNPLFDPHGDPIPAPDGTLPQRTLQPLSELPLNTPACISRLTATNADMLVHTQNKGFTLSTKVIVTARDPFEGPLTVQLAGDEKVIGHLLAKTILVETLA